MENNIMERIKTETVKFTGRDIEILIKKHIKEVENITGDYKIEWQYDCNLGATIVEVKSRCAVATGALE
jgi:hypothetical protein